MKTRGTKRKPLPPATVSALQGLGFIELEDASKGATFIAWRCKRHPHVLVHVAAVNMAGDTDTVVATVRVADQASQHFGRISSDGLRTRLRALLHVMDGGTTWAR